MDVIYLKKRQDNKDSDVAQFIAPAVSLMAKGGLQRLIPHPYGSETIAYESFDEALSAIHRAGYDCEFQGHRYPAPRPSKSTSISKTTASVRHSQHPLKKLMDQAQTHLEERLKDPSPQVIASAAYALGELRALSALDGLYACLAHDDQSVRKNAGEAIAKLGQAAQQTFIKALRDPNWVVRLSALSGLAELMHMDTGTFMECLPHVGPLIKDDNWLVRNQTAHLYGDVARLLRSLEDASPTR